VSYIVRSGDHLSKIAAEHGFADWRPIYDHPHNAALRRRRPDPSLLFPGDRIYIPEREAKALPAPTGREARFRAHRATATLQLTIIDAAGAPRAGAHVTLVIDGEPRGVVLDASGSLCEAVPSRLTHAHLTIDEWTVILAVGHLSPLDEVDDDGVSGVQGRLVNLGFHRGPVTGHLDDDTRAAIRAFQRDRALPESGEIGPALRDQLRTQHGC
jgi:N-acetylmuramoyl-L-alanine amidase